MKSLALLILLLCGSIVYGQSAETIYINTRQANIRESPDSGSKVVATLNINTKLLVTANSGNWYYVTKGNLRGWVHSTVVRTTYRDSIAGALQKPSSTAKNEWLFLAASGGDDLEFYQYNPSRVSRQGNIVTAWVKLRLIKTKAIEQHQYNCASLQFRLLALTTYHDDGKVDVLHTELDQKWTPIFPDTIGEEIVKKLCALNIAR